MIYVAHPYSTGTTGLPLDQILKKVGLFAYSAHIANHKLYYPVLMGENMLRWSDTMHRTEHHIYDFWAEHAKHMIERSEEIWVFAIKGWEYSEGVREELIHAIDFLEKPARLIFDEGAVYKVFRASFQDLIEDKIKFNVDVKGGGILIEKAKV